MPSKNAFVTPLVNKDRRIPASTCHFTTLSPYPVPGYEAHQVTSLHVATHLTDTQSPYPYLFLYLVPAGLCHRHTLPPCRLLYHRRTRDPGHHPLPRARRR